MKPCPFCGKEISENDKFCGWCGRKLSLAPSQEEKKVTEEIKEAARQKERDSAKAQEREKEQKIVQKIQDRAQKENLGIEQEETRKEKIIEKLTETSKEEEKRRKEFVGMLRSKPRREVPLPQKEKKKQVIFRPVFQTKPSSFEKIANRIIIILLIFSVIGAILVFGFDILGLNETPSVPNGEPSPPIDQEPIDGPGSISVPPSLLSVENTSVIEISSNEEISAALSSKLNSGLPEGSFSRIVINNIDEEKTVNLEEFLEALKIETPEWFFQKVKTDFTLLTYAPQNNQIAFITELKEPFSLMNERDEKKKREELEELFLSWEKTIKGDFEPLFKIMGKEKLMAEHSFQSVTRSGQNYRYLTFYQESFGISYGLIKDYFIFTTSQKSMTELIDHKVEITEELKKGDRGTEVEILQNWLAKDIKIYPEGIVTGYYGSLSQIAVKRFQQKYSEEILKPWGYVEGTGMVDEATKKKLNEVYKR